MVKYEKLNSEELQLEIKNIINKYGEKESIFKLSEAYDKGADENTIETQGLNFEDAV